MKIKLLAIMMFITSVASSQTVLRTYKNSVGYYNNLTQQYEFSDYTYSNLVFTFYSDYITVNDITHSVYRVVENLPKRTTSTNETVSARCLDENNRSCVLGIMTYTDGSNPTIAVIYSEKMFLYILDK